MRRPDYVSADSRGLLAFSFWQGAPQAGFTALCETQIPRLRESKYGKSSVLIVAKDSNKKVPIDDE